jgi:hypothetical protein
LAGVAAACAWGVLKDRQAIIAGQVAQCVSFGMHFALIGAYTGSALCALSLVQLTAASALTSRAAHGVFWATVPAIALFTLATWDGLPSAAAAAGLAFATLGRWQRDPLRLRWFFLGSSSDWEAHNILVLSPFGLATDALTLGTSGWRIWRTYAARDRGEETMRGWMRRRVERQAQLMGAMMERVGVDPAAAPHGRALAAAGRRCLWCASSQRCMSWLPQAGPVARAPSFCPNARLLEDARVRADPN